MKILLSVILFLGSFALYVTTVCPSVYMDDSGEIATAAATLGIAHPPSYPLITLLGRGLQSLPAGSPGYRVNLAAALAGSVAVVLMFHLILVLGRGLQLSRRDVSIGAFSGAVFFAFCPVFWQQALVAKGGVYTLNAALTLGALICLFRWRETLERRWVLFYFFLFGLSMGHHYMSFLMLGPGMLVFFVKERRRLLGPHGLYGFLDRVIFPAVLIAVLAFVFYPAYLLIRSRLGPSFNWGDPSTFERLWWVFSRQEYAEFAGAKTGTDYLSQVWWMLRLPFAQYVWPFVLLAGAGGWRLWKQDRAAAWLFLLSLAVLTAGVIVGTPADLLKRWFMEIYSIPVCLLIAALGGVGTAWFLSRAVRPGWNAGAVVMPIILSILCLWQWAVGAILDPNPRCDRAFYFFATDMARNYLRFSEPGSVLFIRIDPMLFPVWYEQVVRGERTDVCVVGSGGLSMDWVRRDMAKKYPWLLFPVIQEGVTDRTPGLAEGLTQGLVMRNYGQTPLNFAYHRALPDTMKDYRTVPDGVFYRVRKGLMAALPTGREEKGRLPAEWSGLVFRGLFDEDIPKDSPTMDVLLSNYSVFFNTWGLQKEEQKDLASAQQAYQLALAVTPRDAGIFLNLGNTYLQQDLPDKALEAYNRCLELNPLFAGAYFSRGLVRIRMGRIQEAIPDLQMAAKLEPNNPSYRSFSPASLLPGGNNRRPGPPGMRPPGRRPGSGAK